MPREIKGIIVSRLFILLAIIVVPIIIFLLFILADFHVWWTNDLVLEVFIIKFLTPLTYGISWFYFLVLFATRFATTIDSMEKTINIIPLRLKIFYGINAMFVLFIFGFPLITPLISIVSFASLAWQLTTMKKKNWDDRSKPPLITYILMVIASFLPLFCTFNIAVDYIRFPAYLAQVVWLPLLDYIYNFSYSLCTSLAIGSLFILFANKGVSEYEQFFLEPKQEKSIFYIKIMEVFLVAFFLYLQYNNLPVIDLFYNMGFIIVLIVSVVNYISGKNQSKKFSSHVFGYILAAIFMGSNLLLFNVILSDLLRNASLVILSAIFLIVFTYTFITVEE